MALTLSPLRRATAAAALAAITGCGGATPRITPGGEMPASLPAGSRPLINTSVSTWKYKTVDDPNSGGISVLTGINNQNKLVGYYGSAASGPFVGFYVVSPYGSGNFFNVSYPGAESTQVMAANNTKWMAGVYTLDGWVYGFTLNDGVWTSYKDPKLRHDNGKATWLLGISDSELAVGYYVGATGHQNGFELDIPTAKYHGVSPPSGSNGIATAINGKGDIAGTVSAGGSQEIFLLKGGQYSYYSFPGAIQTQAYSINWQDQIAGSYQDSSGATHGFVLSNPLTSEQWQQVDEPAAAGTTVITGLDNHHYMCGYYVDSAGATHGFFASPTANPGLVRPGGRGGRSSRPAAR